MIWRWVAISAVIDVLLVLIVAQLLRISNGRGRIPKRR